MHFISVLSKSKLTFEYNFSSLVSVKIYQLIFCFAGDTKNEIAWNVHLYSDPIRCVHLLNRNLGLVTMT